MIKKDEDKMEKISCLSFRKMGTFIPVSPLLPTKNLSRPPFINYISEQKQNGAIITLTSI